ncbi:hypothetical protein F0562_005941 [Nyssa sinensis]|uniref:Uncharacterized protein n=1 Tax=Nyssa sinensis TaxID=561372 RepID=A0A5J5AN81_9ASTE|nr:hypothetical protein F0562_005941 [Nyssa sinensis]
MGVKERGAEAAKQRWFIHIHLGSGRCPQHQHYVRPSNDVLSVFDLLLDDADLDDRSGNGSEDRIDELDVFQDKFDQSRVSDKEEIFRVVEIEDEEIDLSRISGYHLDHISGVIRCVLDKRSTDQGEDYASFDANLGLKDWSKFAFGLDDMLVDGNVRRKVGEVPGNSYGIQGWLGDTHKWEDSDTAWLDGEVVAVNGESIKVLCFSGRTSICGSLDDDWVLPEIKGTKGNMGG